VLPTKSAIMPPSPKYQLSCLFSMKGLTFHKWQKLAEADFS
jgi:hypothetical protein